MIRAHNLDLSSREGDMRKWQAFPIKETTEHDDGEEEIASELGVVAAHEAGHIEIAHFTEVEVEWARAKQAGTGTTKIANLESAPPRKRALIAVAGRVAEEVLCRVPRKTLPGNDRDLLYNALNDLGDDTITEEALREEVREILEECRERAERVQMKLIATSNANVSGAALRGAAEGT